MVVSYISLESTFEIVGSVVAALGLVVALQPGARAPRANAIRIERRWHLPRHPELNLIDTVCATCGTTFMVRSPAESLSLDICSNCHPACTGVQRAAARGDRIERFNRRRALATVAA